MTGFYRVNVSCGLKLQFERFEEVAMISFERA
jgi:hypothetical protein